MTKAQREIKPKLDALNHARTSRSVAVTCRHFGISRSAFYNWKVRYEKFGEAGLINKNLFLSLTRLKSHLKLKK